jgi:hypothetical protein
MASDPVQPPSDKPRWTGDLWGAIDTCLAAATQTAFDRAASDALVHQARDLLSELRARVSAPTPDHPAIEELRKLAGTLGKQATERFAEFGPLDPKGSAYWNTMAHIEERIIPRLGGTMYGVAGVGGVPAEPQPETLVAEPPCSCLCHYAPSVSAHFAPCCDVVAGAVPQDREAGQ